MARYSKAKVLALVATLVAWSPGTAAAFELNGTKSVIATTAQGDRIVLGSVHFTPGDKGEATFVLTMNTESLVDHFLSMREFKCLPGQTELTCYVPYPYANPRTISTTNYAWLEHSLLFFYKAPAEFGAKLWNGIYFELQPIETGLVGKPQAIDLNAISAPHSDLSKPPFRRALRDDMPAQARWIRTLSIE